MNNVSIHDVYFNAHDREGLVQILNKAAGLGVIIIDNGHGYGFLPGEKTLHDFSPVPYREALEQQLRLFEIDDGKTIIPVYGKYGLAALLILKPNANPDMVQAALNSLRLYDEFRNSMDRDTKLGIFNKRYLLDQKPRSNYGLLMLDLDYFKQINDTYGHETGDRVLRDFVNKVQEILPNGAVLARYGGEEFVVYVESANTEEIRELADRINRTVREIEIYGTNLRTQQIERIDVTVSIGGGVYRKYMSIYDAMENADNLMYRSKNNGRDCSTISGL
jgi:diguanylate cyclase (GGDEF)-like protein